MPLAPVVKKMGRNHPRHQALTRETICRLVEQSATIWSNHRQETDFLIPN